jgi:hypothetical protein|tara:strand:- start:275 stop:1300 length:1026 start_codon:yes stop_codon:yes gene_type:complete
MSYTQRFGLSRKSPLSYEFDENQKVGYYDSAKKAWISKNDPRHDGRTYADRDKEVAKIARGEDSDMFRAAPASDIINKNNQYSKEQLADYDYDKGYNIAGKNIFGLTREEMQKGAELEDVKRRRKEVSTGKVGPEIKEGFDPDGNPSLTKRKDGTYVYGDQVVDAPKDGQKFRAGLDEFQTGLDIVSTVDPTGFVADGLNAITSGARGIGALAQGDYESAKKFGKAGAASTFFMIPGTDIGKVGKFNKMMSKAGKTRHVSKTGRYKQPIFEKESNIQNLLRGVGNFTLRKGKQTKVNKNVASLFGGGKIGKKIAENTTSAKGIKNYSKIQDSDSVDKEKES